MGTGQSEHGVMRLGVDLFLVSVVAWVSDAAQGRPELEDRHHVGPVIPTTPCFVDPEMRRAMVTKR